jgi:hypothetical protein
VVDSPARCGRCRFTGGHRFYFRGLREC